MVGAAGAELERAKGALPTFERDATPGGKVFVDSRRAPNPVLFHLDRAEVRAGEHVVLRDVRSSIGREDKLHLVGPNGAGKTNLLRALSGLRDRGQPRRGLRRARDHALAGIAGGEVR